MILTVTFTRINAGNLLCGSFVEAVEPDLGYICLSAVPR